MSCKTCKGCGIEKDLSEFYAADRNVDGRMGKCKSCVKAMTRNYRLSHREQYAKIERARANLPHRIAARRKYQEEHKEQIAEYKRSWMYANAQRVAISRRDYYERNREEVISRSREWATNNPEKVRMAKADNRRKRRAAKHAGRGNFTAREFRELCEKYDNRCLCCGDTDTVLEADHIVPLTRGGTNDIGNIQPLCGSCNRKKFVSIVDLRTSEDILF